MPTLATETARVRDGTDVVRVRELVRARAIEIGLSLVDQTKIVTAASEIARNTLDYGGGGIVRLDIEQVGLRRAVRLTFEDEGPGIADVERAMTDHFTTGGGMGLGLGGAKRLCNEFAIHSGSRTGNAHRAGEVEMITAVLPIREPSQVADARRRAADRARALPLSDLASGRLSIVVTELATNLIKFGREGNLLLGTYEDDEGEGIQLVALDKGPGMVSVARCMEDGFSTAGSAGKGLGAVRRLAKSFAIESWPNGTAVLARVGPGKAGNGGEPFFGTLEIPLAGEVACGDAICARRHANGWTIIVADGLGHGPQAADASMEALRLFRRVEHETPVEIVAAVHQGLRHTRGAAVAVARLDLTRALLTFTGIGNIAAAIVTTRERRNLVSLPGTAGHNARKIAPFDYSFPPSSLLVMHSDGLSDSWSFDATPGLFAAHPTIVAGVLFRDHGRARDDASVIVARGAA